jgi:hypothetical protein
MLRDRSLSGFIYDLRSVPAVIQWITYVLPARYAVSLMQTLYLAGDGMPDSLSWLGFSAAWGDRIVHARRCGVDVHPAVELIPAGEIARPILSVLSLLRRS